MSRKRLQTGRIVLGKPHFGVITPDWHLNEPSDDVEHARSFTIEVPFADPGMFSRPPQVEVSLASFDASSMRLAVFAQNVNRYGFDLVVTTWYDTVVTGVGVVWTAKE